MKHSRVSQVVAPVADLSELIKKAYETATTAARNGKSLDGDNHYGNKFASLRSDANHAMAALTRENDVDVTELQTHIDNLLRAKISKSERVFAFREATHLLKGLTATPAHKMAAVETDAIFPMTLLEPTRRGYLVTLGKQMNGCFREGWYDACAVMMRRLVEATIIEAFEGKSIAHKIRDERGVYFQLTDLVAAALSETHAWTLSRTAKDALPKLRDLGHRSAHGRTFTAQRADIEKLQGGVRIVVEEFLRIAGLLLQQ